MGKFDIYQPCKTLAPYIKQFAISESEQAQTYRVLPDSSMVMGIQYRGKLAQVVGNGHENLSLAGITGLLDGYRVFQSSSHVGSVLVYFKSPGASAFFTQPLHELFGQSIPLDNLFARDLMERLREQVAEAKTDPQRIQAVEHFLVSQLRFPQVDALVSTAIQHIQQAQGHVRIKELAAALYISQSALEKRFRKVVGASPKKYASIIRLNHAVSSYTATASLTELGLKTGYYDQAHFIKDFKQFSGETPEAFFHKP